MLVSQRFTLDEMIKELLMGPIWKDIDLWLYIIEKDYLDCGRHNQHINQILDGITPRYPTELCRVSLVPLLNVLVIEATWGRVCWRTSQLVIDPVVSLVGVAWRSFSVEQTHRQHAQRGVTCWKGNFVGLVWLTGRVLSVRHWLWLSKGPKM